MGISRNLSSGGLETNQAEIEQNTTKTVEEIPLIDFKFLKYFIIFFNDSETLTKSMEVTIKKENNIVESTVRNRIGTSLELGVVASVSGSNFKFDVINEENFKLNMNYSKITL